MKTNNASISARESDTEKETPEQTSAAQATVEALDKSSTKRRGQDVRWDDHHWDLRFLGPEHATIEYELSIAGRRYPLQRHTEATLATAGLGNAPAPTHFASQVAVSAEKVHLALVYGSEATQGMRPLVGIAIVTPDGSRQFQGEASVANALVFLNPSVTVLTPRSAETVLNAIANSSGILQLQALIGTLGGRWNRAKPITDEAGTPILDASGQPRYFYDLDPAVLRSAAPAAGEAKAVIYSDPSLRGVRWDMQPGVSHLDVSEPDDTRTLAALPTGVRYNLKDGGPNFGISCRIRNLSDDLVLDVSIRNNLIRFVSIFASFKKGDGKTPIIVPDNIWTELAKGATNKVILPFYNRLAGKNEHFPFQNRETLKFLGWVASESTFFGVPVDAGATNFSFQLPSVDADGEDVGPIGLIRLSAGSLGVSSHLPEDPSAAVVGIALTTFLNLVVPTASLVAGVGLPSSSLLRSLLNPTFLVPTAANIITVTKDLIENSENTGNDLRAVLLALSERITQTVLTSTEVAAKFAAVLGAEAAAEAIPIAGWALKLIALEGTAAQLAQTVGEIIASPRVVNFDITVTMDAEITLVPAPDESRRQPEFAATATNYSITAQYSDNTSRVFNGRIDDPKTGELAALWRDIPVGGKGSFLVALFSQEGVLVGRGASAKVDNHPGPSGRLEVTIPIEQILFPLNKDTFYSHRQVLRYEQDGYRWHATTLAPAETATALGTGSNGHLLETLNGIVRSNDAGLLGYVWQASGLNIPPLDGSGERVQLYTFQNLAFGPSPNAGFMRTSAGYAKPPQLVYLSDTGENSAVAFPNFLFVDPSGDEQTGFHLRKVVPVTDAEVALDDPRRLFDQARGESWGRFNFLPDAVAVHANGFVVAINRNRPSLQILPLPAASSADDRAPWAHIYSGPGTRAGLLDRPQLVAIAPNQTIYVLEAGNRRIQAFSRAGHPVPAFPDTDTPYWIPLPGSSLVNSRFLAMSLEVQGHIYVLRQVGNGAIADDFHLDIFSPSGKRLTTQQGINAAGLTVDLWRNLYTQNFQTLLGLGGRTEPSISEWIPRLKADAQSAKSNRDGPHVPDAAPLPERVAAAQPTEVTRWSFTVEGLGNVRTMGSQVGFAGGLAVVGIDSRHGAFSYPVFQLEPRSGQVALFTIIRGAGKTFNLYWTSHWHPGSKDNAMVIWDAHSGKVSYQSDRIGSEQLFILHNLGRGRISLEAVAARGQFMTGIAGGWYPREFGLGTGTLTIAPNQPGAAGTVFQINGSQLPILTITGNGANLDLAGANLTGLSLAGSDLSGTTLDGADLTGVEGGTLTGAKFDKASLRGAKLNGLSLGEAASFAGAIFDQTDLSVVKTARSAKMSDAAFVNANLSGVDFGGADLQRVDFTGVNLSGTLLNGANLDGAKFVNATLKGTQFVACSMRGAQFTGVDLSTATFDAKPIFTRNSQDPRTSFHNSLVPYAVLDRDWSYLDLQGATILDIPASLENLMADSVVLPDGLDLSRRSLVNASFQGAQMYEVVLNDADLANANLSKAKLKGSSLVNANFTSANLDSAFLIAEEAAAPTARLQSVDRLQAAVASNAIFINARLDGAFCDGVEFTKALFVYYPPAPCPAASAGGACMTARGARFNLAKFSGAHLLQANFDDAQMAGVDLADAVMVGSSLRDSLIIPSSEPPRPAASLNGADIRGADFTNADMGGANLSGAIFSATNGVYATTLTGFAGEPIAVRFRFGATVLGNTTDRTTCPDRKQGPCRLPADAGA